MCEQGATRTNIYACIGPTIHQDSYEVREDFIQQLELLSDFDTEKFIRHQHGKSYFDLLAYILAQCKRSHIDAEALGIDTYTREDEYFSFRRNTHAAEKEYGRQISIIALS